MTDSNEPRNVVFISKATPGDDEFTLWLAPKLEAAGYRVFADILALQAGENWRKVLTDTLQKRAIKMLLCCRDSTLQSAGVQEEIAIAQDLAKELDDERYIIPLRIEPYKKLFGIANLQYINFERGWAHGLVQLLDGFKRQGVLQAGAIEINSHWEAYRKRSAILVEKKPERLTSNWLRISEFPDHINFYVPSGAVDRPALSDACERGQYPCRIQSQGFLSFALPTDIEQVFGHLGRFVCKYQFEVEKFREEGASDLGLSSQDAQNSVSELTRKAWEHYCEARGFLRYNYSKLPGFHVTADQAKLNQRIPWGRQGERHSSALRNTAKGHVWQYGVTAIPYWWPYPHLRLKSRVLFAPPLNEDAGDPYDNARKQHRLRRTVCKSWRNKQWHGRMLAYLELLSGDSSLIRLKLGADTDIVLDSSPILFTSPVTTVLPDALDAEMEEADESTLGRPEPEEEEL